MSVRWLDRAERVDVSARVCRDAGCAERTTAWFDPGLRRWVIQHGPNPEHVLLARSQGYLSVGNLERPAGDWATSVDDWLWKIHSPAAARERSQG